MNSEDMRELVDIEKRKIYEMYYNRAKFKFFTSLIVVVVLSFIMIVVFIFGDIFKTTSSTVVFLSVLVIFIGSLLWNIVDLRFLLFIRKGMEGGLSE